ncbi:MAG: MoxR family ATPase [Deltaproteobacteria bacterium]|nr:MoxR family ATPase [Deltaproteobacteria bacterium]
MADRSNAAPIMKDELEIPVPGDEQARRTRPPRPVELRPDRRGRKHEAPGLLRDLGFFGLEQIEVSILAGLVTGDPVLLVGAHGAAKTALVRSLATQLELRFWAYDSSKALFEDVIGFPNPKSLAEGAVDYVATPLSVWDKEFVLLDEISRASPAMQNKWLELVRSRRMMGREVPALRYIFAAMNPPEYLGANPLDEALAGRFAFVIPVPDVMTMNDADLAAIVETAMPDDAPLCPTLHRVNPAQHGDDERAGSRRRSKRTVASLLAAARAMLPAVAGKHGAFATRYTCAVAGELLGKKLRPDGRRLGMLRRNLLAVLAVERTMGSLRADWMEQIFFRTLEHSLPYRAIGETPTTETLYPCHALAWRTARDGADAAGVFARVAGRGDLQLMLHAYEKRLDELSEEDHHQTLNTILERIEEAKDADLAIPVMALCTFARLAALSPARVPADVTVRALERVQKLAAYGPAGWAAYTDVLDRRNNVVPALQSAPQSFALRVAVEYQRRNDDDPCDHVDPDAARALFRSLVASPAFAGAAASPRRSPATRRCRRRRSP